jgi:hypothetical protein
MGPPDDWRMVAALGPTRSWRWPRHVSELLAAIICSSLERCHMVDWPVRDGRGANRVADNYHVLPLQKTLD